MSELITVARSPFGRPVDIQYDVYEHDDGEDILLVDVLLGSEVLDAAWLSGWVTGQLVDAVEDARAGAGARRVRAVW